MPLGTTDPLLPVRVGVLALQGGYAAHIAVLRSLGAEAFELRNSNALHACDALVLPGGESTTMTRLLDGAGEGFRSALEAFCAKKPVMGTCAGLILLSREAGDARVKPFNLLPLTVERNAYGRQNESAVRMLKLDPTLGGPGEYRGVFIRAPRIVDWDKEVIILAREPAAIQPGASQPAASQPAAGHQQGENGAPVLVRYRHILGLSFHPELTPEDPRIHAYFLAMCREAKGSS